MKTEQILKAFETFPRAEASVTEVQRFFGLDSNNEQDRVAVWRLGQKVAELYYDGSLTKTGDRTYRVRGFI